MFVQCAVFGDGKASAGPGEFRVDVANGCHRPAEERIASQVRHDVKITYNTVTPC